MDIHWAALGQVFVVSLVMTIGLVAVFTLGIVGNRANQRAEGGTALLARTGAWASYALCAAAVAYGIYIIAS
ncbi:hypothetical protein CUT44_06565 [Streptomyces carminius]|uniref:Uncharacterized protein n=1 Tax=Streptomyces carminius TaxID=2665496 RepID=A0A2M8M2E4_9ACTN|nr:hypothetical protein [Streptomyces carminius]PJE98373.1 hypothetical protein CUT44_06565 [Streptomyces carminius]